MPRVYNAAAEILPYRHERLRLVLADERTILRRGVRAMLQGEPDLEVIGEASRVSDAIALARCLQPDVVVTDVFENGGAIAAIREMQRECAGLRVVVLTACTDPQCERASMRAGAHAYVTIDAPIEVLLRAIRVEIPEIDLPAASSPVTAVRRRPEDSPAGARVEITGREREVLVGVALGLSSKRIAADLGRSVKTIEKHRFKMMHKLGLRNASAVTRYAIDNGLLDARRAALELRAAILPAEN
ncbi:MAG: response regulator transcription factor [Gammaproteobacteria bacterium]